MSIVESKWKGPVVVYDGARQKNCATIAEAYARAPRSGVGVIMVGGRVFAREYAGGWRLVTAAEA